MEEYSEFVKIYFPFSYNIQNGENIYGLVCENNLISKIILKYVDLHIYYTNEEKLIFYRRFRDGVNKLLLYLPLNEEIGIYASMRYSIEQLLKFIYAIYFDKEVYKISTTGYRHIKEDIKKNVNIDSDIKYELQKLYTYYASYSNDIHDKEIDYDKELVSLGKIVRAENKYANGIENDLRNILTISYVILSKIFHVKYEMLDAAERMSIESLQSRGRKKNIHKILKYDA